MKKPENDFLTKQEVNKILSDSFDENFWLYQLGISISDVDEIETNRFTFPFFEKGKEYYQEIKEKVYQLICDETQRRPKKNIRKHLEGDKKDLIASLASLLLVSLELEKEIIIPVTALILKNGIEKFCS